jgi:hypothetical protein
VRPGPGRFALWQDQRPYFHGTGREESLPLAEIHGVGVGNGLPPLAEIHGVGVGNGLPPLADSLEWVAIAFRPIALVKINNTKTTTTNHLFM